MPSIVFTHTSTWIILARGYSFNLLSPCREIFLRELISNANDALEKLRLTALMDKNVWDGAESLNITIRVFKNEDGPGGRLVIGGEVLYAPRHHKNLI